MATEIERKFKVDLDRWQPPAQGERICQGYIASEDAQIRVRLTEKSGFLTIKSRDVGLVRAEFEYPIPREDAEELLDRFAQQPYLSKTRYRVTEAGRLWEVDEFHGGHAGLVLAEVELESTEAVVELPVWAGEEVTGDVRFTNEDLAQQLRSATQ